MRILFIFVIGIMGSKVFAAGELAQTFTLDGQLLQVGNDQPLLDNSAKIVLQILDPSKTCLLYEEQQFVDTTTSNGYYSIQVGSSTGAAKRTSNDPGRTMAQIYQNTSAITANSVSGFTCSGGIYNPTAGSSRYLRITVTPSASGVADTLSPDTTMDSVASALVAQTLQGMTPSQFLQVGTGDLTQANLQTVFATGNAANLASLLSVSPSNYVTKDSTNGTIRVPSSSGPSSPQTGQIWYDSVSGNLKYWNGSEQVVGVASAPSPSTYVLNGGQAGAVVIGSTDSNSVTLKANNSTAMTILPSGYVGIGTSNPGVSLDVSGAIAVNGGSFISLNGSGSPTSTAIRRDNSLNAMTFRTNNANRMLIDDSGNVGIGLTSPLARLDVSSALTATSGIKYGFRSESTYNPASAPSSGTTINNVYTYMNTLGTSNMSDAIVNGGNYTTQHNATSTLGTGIGFQGAVNNASTGAISIGMGTQSLVSNLSTGTINTAYGVQTSISNTGGGIITNGMGIYIGNIQATNKFGIYQADSGALNYFSGKIGVGTTNPAHPLEVRTTNTSATGNHYGNLITMSAAPTTSGNAQFGAVVTSADYAGNVANTGGLVGYSSDVTHSGTGDLSGLTGYNVYVANSTTATTTNAMGINSGVFLSSTGEVTYGTGGYFSVYRNGTGVMSAGTAGYFNVTNAATGAMGAAYGGNFSVVNSGGGTIGTSYGIYIGQVQGTSKYSLYASDAGAASYFAGSVGVGGVSPQATLDINGYARLKSYSSAPVACSSTNAGAIALNSSYLGCVCNGTSWIKLADGTACVW